jgi:hypothetical protein
LKSFRRNRKKERVEVLSFFLNITNPEGRETGIPGAVHMQAGSFN